VCVNVGGNICIHRRGWVECRGKIWFSRVDRKTGAVAKKPFRIAASPYNHSNPTILALWFVAEEVAGVFVSSPLPPKPWAHRGRDARTCAKRLLANLIYRHRSGLLHGIYPCRSVSPPSYIAFLEHATPLTYCLCRQYLMYQV